MSYTAFSVVFGEQPSASKWNTLGTNDAGFKDGTNIDDDAILARHIADGAIDAAAKIADGVVTSPKLAEAFFRGKAQNDNDDSITDSTPTGLTVQFGWIQRVGDNTSEQESTVTFPTAFTTLLYVGATFIGAKSTTAATSITDFTTAVGTAPVSVAAATPSTAGFVMKFTRSDSGTLGSSAYWGASWIAIGTV